MLAADVERIALVVLGHGDHAGVAAQPADAFERQIAFRAPRRCVTQGGFIDMHDDLVMIGRRHGAFGATGEKGARDVDQSIGPPCGQRFRVVTVRSIT